MNRRARYLSIALLIFVICGSGFFVFLNSSQHIWKTVNETITYGGQPSPGSEAYLSRSGDLLIDLRSHGDAIYIVKPRTKDVGLPNQSNFVMAIGYAYSKELWPPTVSMQHSGGKIETDPELRVEPYLIEFTSVKKARVRVTWYLHM